MIRSGLLSLLLLVPLLATARAAQDPDPAVAPAAEPAAQEPAAEEPAAQEPAAEASAAPATPTTVDEALALGAQAWADELEELDDAELAARLEAWTRLAEEESARLGAEPSLALGELAAIAADRDLLVERAEAVAAVLAARGADVSAVRQRLEAARTSSAPLELDPDEDVPLEVLRAWLRPMTKEEVEGRLPAWLAALQTTCLAVRNVELAALAAEGEEARRFYERTVLLQRERQALIQRVDVVLDVLEEKGGDVEELRAWVDSVVDRPAITGVTAFVAMARTWLFSAEGGGELLLDLLKAAGAIVAAWFLSILLANLASRGMRRLRNLSALLRDFVVLSVRRVTVFFGVLVALSLLGVNMGPLLAAIGAAGLVVGLALQGTLSNFASGILIMVNRPFDVGDLIQVGSVLGTVRGLTLITTRVETFDNQVLYVPNNMVWNDVITNVAANPTRRVDLVVGISYGDDMQRAREVILEALRAHPKVLADPAPNVRVHALADSSVNLIVRPWVRTEDYWDVYWDLTQAVKERLDAEGITIPFPQRDVHHHYEGTPPPLAEPGPEPSPKQEPEPRDEPSREVRPHGSRGRAGRSGRGPVEPPEPPRS